jgi:hypothetical protein
MTERSRQERAACKSAIDNIIDTTLDSSICSDLLGQVAQKIPAEKDYLETMRNLLPETSTDKKGNAVTRWLRSLRKTSNEVEDAPSLPVDPYGGITGEEDRFIPENQKDVSDFLESIGSQNTPAANSPLLRKVRIIVNSDIDLSRSIVQAARSSEEDREYWADQISLSSNIGSYEQEKRELELSHFRIALPVNSILREIGHNFNKPMQNDHPYLLPSEFVYLIMTNGNITNPSDELTKVITLMAYIKDIRKFGSSGQVDWNLSPSNTLLADATYIADHFEQVIGLLPELVTRKTYDRSVIDMLLNHDAQALREGEL